MIQIQCPIWKSRSVGIADDRITPVTEIEILYKTKDGNRLYPNPFKIYGHKAKRYPVQTVRGRVLRIIPISDMETV